MMSKRGMMSKRVKLKAEESNELYLSCRTQPKGPSPFLVRYVS